MANSAKVKVHPMLPFGIEIDWDLSRPLGSSEKDLLAELMQRHSLILFRNQQLDEEAQVKVLSSFGNVLGAKGEYREISSDGNLGAGPLAFHSDLAFTTEPFKILSLHALDVNDGESWTDFANGISAVGAMPPQLAARIKGRDARTVISLVQSHRHVSFDNPSSLPQQVRSAVIDHPRSGKAILYVSEMQTARIEGLPQAQSDALLTELFAILYAPSNVYRHRWRTGDLVIWDNIALQHARCDLTGMHPRRLQRVAVADKSFFDLCPQFDLTDPTIAAWASGQQLQIA
jgi:taurine dioxygenase